MRRAGLAGLVVVAALSVADVAWADTRFTRPSSTAKTEQACQSRVGCELEYAIEEAKPGDTVIAAAGDYGSATSPLTKQITSTEDDLTIRGVDPSRRPRIFIEIDTTGLWLVGTDVTLRDLELVNPDDDMDSVALFAPGEDVLVERVIARSISGINVQDGTVRDSILVGAGPGQGLEVFMGGSFDLSLLNVTAIGAGGAHGIHASAAGASSGTVGAVNTIAQARGSGTDLVASASGSAAMTINLVDSNFASVAEEGSGDAEVNDIEGNARDDPPAFRNPAGGDYRQGAGSSTIDAGRTDPDLGSQDVDGDGRNLGSGPDMGADEFVPGAPVASTGAATQVGQSSARLNGTVDPNGLVTTYRFEYGTTSGYGSATSNQTTGSVDSVEASAAITGLPAGTTIHYRLVAGNANGTSTGVDRTFTTSLSPNGPGPGPGGGPLVRLLGPVVVPRVFRFAFFLPRFAQARGAVIAFGISQRALAGIQFGRVSIGRRFRGRCLPSFAVLRRFPRCVRLSAAGLLVTTRERGIHRLRFGGRLSAGRFLRPGYYVVRVLARDPASGTIVRTRLRLFRVLAPG